MTLHENPAVGANASDRWLFRAGALSAFVVVAGYLATFPLYAQVGGPPPSGVEANLEHYGQHLGGWWAILWLMVSTDLFFAVTWLALYQALRGVDRNLMLLALGFAGLFVALDLALTWPCHAVLFALSGSYAEAAEGGRAAIVAAAGFPALAMESALLRIYGILFPALGIALAGPVMRKAAFGRSAALVAFLVGITGVVAVAGPFLSKALTLAPVVNALLVMLWFLLVGVRLLRLARS